MSASDKRANIPQAAPPFEEDNQVTSGGLGCASNIIHITKLPDDVFDNILSHLQALELVNSVENVCRTFRQASNSIYLWKELCFQTGKILSTSINLSSESLSKSAMSYSTVESNSYEDKYSIFSLSSFESSHVMKEKDDRLYDVQSNKVARKTEKHNIYRQHYFKNPCVPVDIPTIQEAVDNCPRGGTITILPGAYFENINCINKDHITIRAAFPHIGAALIHHEKSFKNSAALNNPAILVSGASSNVTISHLQALHSSPGIDIWSGNCVVHCDDSACLHLHHSSLQSDSGRGVVVTGGSQLILSNSILHDCAATGLYVGDVGTQGFVYGCNIIENGFGSARHLSRERRRLIDNDLNWNEEDSSSDEDENENDHSRTSQRQRVPPGHSGMYVETARAIVHDSMISGNSLTGLSVVRQGTVQLSGSNLSENGDEPVTVDDIPPFGHWGNASMSRGGIFFGPAPNNFTNAAPFGDNETASGRISHVALNEKNRFSPFHDTISQSITISKLKKKYMQKGVCS